MNNIFELLGDYFVILALIPFCYIPVRDFPTRNKPTLTIQIIVSLSLFITVTLCTAIGFPGKTPQILTLPTAVYFYIFYHSEINLPTYQKLFWFCSSLMLETFTCLLSSMTYVFIYPYIQHPALSILCAFPEPITVRMCQTLLLLLADGLLYIPVHRYISGLFKTLHGKRLWKYIWSIPVIFTVFYGYLGSQHQWFKSSLPESVAVVFILFFVNLLIYAMVYWISQLIAANEQLNDTNQMLSLYESQYTQLLDHIQETSRQRHDFRHQLTVISELLNHENYQGAREYLNAYSGLLSRKLIRYTDSAAMNALLSHYANLCNAKEIHTDFKLQLPQNLPITDIDLCTLLGNLLENAVHGCTGTAAPCITLKAAQTAPHLIAIQIGNPYEGTLIHRNGKFISTKHKAPGIGLDSVHRVTEKYQGKLEISDDQQYFLVKILLRW